MLMAMLGMIAMPLPRLAAQEWGAQEVFLRSSYLI
ncbi:hypothetical protein ACVI1L_004807 [Bradyrhizobium sp. USDA 4516]